MAVYFLVIQIFESLNRVKQVLLTHPLQLPHSKYSCTTAGTTGSVMQYLVRVLIHHIVIVKLTDYTVRIRYVSVNVTVLRPLSASTDFFRSVHQRRSHPPPHRDCPNYF